MRRERTRRKDEEGEGGRESQTARSSAGSQIGLQNANIKLKFHYVFLFKVRW